MAAQLQFEPFWQASIEQNTHDPPVPALFGCDACQRCLSRHFKDRNSVLACHVGEILKENIQRIASFEVIEQRLNRHARTCKHRPAAKALRI